MPSRCRLAADDGPCRETFSLIPLFYPRKLADGDRRQSVDSVPGCESECLGQSSCARFVFVHGTKQFGCYLFSKDSVFDRDVYNKTGMSTYLRRKCPSINCDQGSPSSKPRQHSRWIWMRTVYVPKVRYSEDALTLILKGDTYIRHAYTGLIYDPYVRVHFLTPVCTARTYWCQQEGQHPLTGQRAPPISGGT